MDILWSGLEGENVSQKCTLATEDKNTGGERGCCLIPILLSVYLEEIIWSVWMAREECGLVAVR